MFIPKQNHEINKILYLLLLLILELLFNADNMMAMEGEKTKQIGNGTNEGQNMIDTLNNEKDSSGIVSGEKIENQEKVISRSPSTSSLSSESLSNGSSKNEELDHKSIIIDENELEKDIKTISNLSEPINNDEQDLEVIESDEKYLDVPSSPKGPINKTKNIDNLEEELPENSEDFHPAVEEIIEEAQNNSPQTKSEKNLSDSEIQLSPIQTKRKSLEENYGFAIFPKSKDDKYEFNGKQRKSKSLPPSPKKKWIELSSNLFSKGVKKNDGLSNSFSGDYRDTKKDINGNSPKHSINKPNSSSFHNKAEIKQDEKKNEKTPSSPVKNNQLARKDSVLIQSLGMVRKLSQHIMSPISKPFKWLGGFFNSVKDRFSKKDEKKNPMSPKKEHKIHKGEHEKEVKDMHHRKHFQGEKAAKDIHVDEGKNHHK